MVDEQPGLLLLLDTTVLTYLTDPKNPKPEWDSVVQGRTLVLSFVTVGEILHGTLAAGWAKKRIEEVEARLQAYPGRSSRGVSSLCPTRRHRSCSRSRCTP